MIGSPKNVRLTLETLEDRLVPAGNITVILQGNLIDVRGDHFDNGLEIAKGITADAISFRGLNGTTINRGSDQFVLRVPGGIHDLKINMRWGSDELVLSNRSVADPHWPGCLCAACTGNLPIQGNLHILAGNGEDVVQLRAVDVQGNLKLLLEQQRDVAVLESVNVGQDLTVDGGWKADILLVRAAQVTGKTSIKTQAGHDGVGLINSNFLGPVLVDLGTDNDILSAEGNNFSDVTLRGGLGKNEMTEDLEGINTITGTFHHRRLKDHLERIAQVHFGYEGEVGPEHWGRLTPAWVLAEAGRQQTPIAINTATVVSADLPALNFTYQSQANVPFVHNGHTIQVNYPAGSKLTVEGHDFDLLQFHFHALSEHTVDGLTFPLEMHLVHRDAAGNLLVIGVLFTEGAANPAYDALIANLPDHDHPSKTIPGPINPIDLLPADRNYYGYTGSLTTPPASEIVSFGIFTHTVELSVAQLQAIELAIGEPNARPVQPTNERVVLVSQFP